MSADEKAIRALVALWLEASKAGDLETVLGLMSDDVVFLVPGAEPFGKAQFAAAATTMKGMTIAGTSEIQELAVIGDVAYLRNRLDLVLTPPGGGAPQRRAGQTLTILRKGADGRWRLTRDANTSVVA